jgi:hypothetical protein
MKPRCSFSPAGKALQPLGLDDDVSLLQDSWVPNAEHADSGSHCDPR